jgi:bifunctional aspartokinase / homoserine dehydrogenase 1
MTAWRVHKFGGSSVADAACMERVARILEADERPRVAAVLSACRGVTDALLALVAAAERPDGDVAAQIAALRARHVGIAETLLSEKSRQEYVTELDADLHDIAGVMHTVRLIRAASAPVGDLVAGFGELWSTRLFSRYLAERGRRPGAVQWADARDIVEVEWTALGPSVRWEP